MPDGYRILRQRMEVIRPKLFRTAFAWSQDRALADDLAQDTLAKALVKVGQLREIDALEGWLFRIMANLWRDHVRRDRPLQPVEDFDVGTEQSPEETNIQRETVNRVRKAIQGLPESYRMTLVLVDLEGFSYMETAEILDVPVGTVMSRLSRGRNRLKELLNQSDELSGPLVGKSHVRTVK